MRSAMIRIFSASIFCVLTACGGGGSGAGSTSTPNVQPTAAPPAVLGPTSEDLANAGDSKLSATLRTDISELTITWVDRFSAETGYVVEKRGEGGTWEAQEALAAGSGTGSSFQWQRIIDRSGTYRVTATRDGYAVPLEADPGHSELAIDLAMEAMSVQLDRPEPLRGTTQLSVAGADGARSVSYSADLKSIGSSTSGATFPISWGSESVADGAHLLIAQVEASPGSFVLVRRSVTVDNPNIAVSLSFTDSRTGILKLRASASADTGVRSIEFFMNGSSLALLTAPNDGVWWSYSLDTRSFPVGPITVTAVATDNGGERAEVTQQHVIDNSPTLTLDSPVDGAVVSGALLVQGTITDDAPGATVTATLGDVQILAAGEGSFSTSFSLAGLAGGTYTLSVRAKDSAGRRTDIIRGVIVSSVNALAATLVGARAYRSKLLDTENGALLYSLELDPFGPTILRAANGGERTLTFAPGTGYADDWQLSAGRAVMRALGPPTTTRHIYAFDPSGLVRDLSLEVGSGNDDNHPVLRGAWVAWNADVIYNLDTRATYRVPTGGASSDFDLVATPGNEQLIFWAGNGGGAEILRYRLASGTTESLTSDGSLNVYPQSDGARVAWRRSPAGRTTTTPPFDLVVAPLENPAAATALSTSLDDDPGFLLRDGVLAWTEKPAAVPTLKIEDGAGAVVVSATASTRLYSNASGYVLFGENGKLYAWSRTRGKTLVLDALPRSVVQRNGIVFVATGMTDTAIHRIPLQ